MGCRAKTERTEEEKSLWWDRYRRENNELVIVPAVPVHEAEEVTIDPGTGNLEDEAFGPEPTWGSRKGSC